MRYCDIDAPRSRPRTSNVTCRAYRENRTPAWPAELPPPTTTTWESVHASASLGPGPVVDPRAEQVIDPGHLQAAPLDAAGEQHRPPADQRAVRQLGDVARPVGRHADQGPGQQQFGAEPAPAPPRGSLVRCR
jgi:hypothetical protein